MNGKAEGQGLEGGERGKGLRRWERRIKSWEVGGERVGGMEWMKREVEYELEGGEREEEEKGRERYIGRHKGRTEKKQVHEIFTIQLLPLCPDTCMTIVVCVFAVVLPAV